MIEAVDFGTLFKLLACIGGACFLFFRGAPKGQVWRHTKRSFVRNPLLNIGAVLFLVVALALAAFPALRPTWLDGAITIAGIVIIGALAFYFVVGNRAQKKLDADYVKMQTARPKFDDEAVRDPFDSKSQESK